MKRALKSIEPVQSGKVLAAIYGLMSLIFVPFFALFPIIAIFAPKTPGKPRPIGESRLFRRVMRQSRLC
jgi:hypothetical protein